MSTALPRTRLGEKKKSENENKDCEKGRSKTVRKCCSSQTISLAITLSSTVLEIYTIAFDAVETTDKDQSKAGER